MGLLSSIGFFYVIYQLIYAIYPWFLDCDIYLAFKEKFGKPINSLKGKVVWITGASSGIGENLAYHLANAGCKLALSARRRSELERVKATCLEENKNLHEDDIEIIVLDMLNIEEHGTVMHRIINKFGQLDILVNNAGRSQRAEWERIELAVDKEMFDLNVFSVIALSRLAYKYFRDRGEGHIVVTSSLAGVLGAPNSASYTGAKHALHGYFDCYRIEKGNTIPITMVCPGPIQTNFLAECFTDKAGEKLAVNTEVSKRKMSADRCAKLMAIAIANRLTEVWISPPLPLQFVYTVKNFYNLGPALLTNLGPKYFQNIRDKK